MYKPQFQSEDTKFEKSLVSHHKGLLSSYMNLETDFTNSQKRKVLNLYDHEISDTNIRYFLMRPIPIFLKALVTEQLDRIKNYAKDLTKYCEDNGIDTE